MTDLIAAALILLIVIVMNNRILTSHGFFANCERGWRAERRPRR